MAKYLVRGSYTQEGLKGLLKEGGSARRDAVTKAVEAFGGSMEMFYFAFGCDDFFMIFDLPDNATAAAASLLGNAAGTTKVTYTVLVAPEEIDQATELANRKMAAYRPPGK